MTDKTIVMYLLDKLNKLDENDKVLEVILQPMAFGNTDGVDIQALTGFLNRRGLDAHEPDVKRALMSSYYGGILAETLKRKALKLVITSEKFSAMSEDIKPKKKKKFFSNWYKK